jgi:hypothetical protein
MNRLKLLSGDVNWQTYGGKWISKKKTNEDFDYWIVLEFINFLEATGEKINGKDRYIVKIHVVAPSQVPEHEKEQALRSMGMGQSTDEIPNDEMWVEILDSYGTRAVIDVIEGNNIKKLMKKAHDKIAIMDIMFGFFMDQPTNRLGTTGWDMIKGDIMAPMRRMKDDQ